MFDLLQEYIAQHHQLSLAYIGVIGLEKTASRADFSNRLFYPPKGEWKLLDKADGNDESLIHFISRKQQISKEEAREQLEKFCREIREEINLAAEIKFPGIGILKNDENGSLLLDTVVADTMLLKPVMAERVIRKDAAHTILVGDTEKTNFEMNELLHSIDNNRELRWMAWAAAILVFALGMIFYSYSGNKWNIRGSGNQQIITPKPVPAEVSSSFK